MDVVLVGLPGSGKSAVGRRIAHRHAATFIDLDDAIEAAAGRPIPAIFEAEGETGFRTREAAAVEALGVADPEVAGHQLTDHPVVVAAEHDARTFVWLIRSCL